MAVPPASKAMLPPEWQTAELEVKEVAPWIIHPLSSAMLTDIFCLTTVQLQPLRLLICYFCHFMILQVLPSHHYVQLFKAMLSKQNLISEISSLYLFSI